MAFDVVVLVIRLIMGKSDQKETDHYSQIQILMHHSGDYQIYTQRVFFLVTLIDRYASFNVWPFHEKELS